MKVLKYILEIYCTKGTKCCLTSFLKVSKYNNIRKKEAIFNYFGRWIPLIAFVLITILLINERIELWSIGTYVDGAGIRIGLEINDMVPEEKIPSYTIWIFYNRFIYFIGYYYCFRGEKKQSTLFQNKVAVSIRNFSMVHLVIYYWNHLFEVHAIELKN